MNKKKIAVWLAAAVLVVGIIFKNNLIRGYVSLCHSDLENYAVQILDEDATTYGKYGLWKTSAYPEQGMVEFATGGFGLAPSSTYNGFYYSADNSHKAFAAANPDTTTLKIDGDYATWTDGTDNHGSSVRITDNWFWYKATF